MQTSQLLYIGLKIAHELSGILLYTYLLLCLLDMGALKEMCSGERSHNMLLLAVSARELVPGVPVSSQPTERLKYCDTRGNTVANKMSMFIFFVDCHYCYWDAHLGYTSSVGRAGYRLGT